MVLNDPAQWGTQNYKGQFDAGENLSAAVKH